jgi:2-polyprenyl-3-methyl-5-hydroxy-6-metoxy-1,4-benzoquinol methylase
MLPHIQTHIKQDENIENNQENSEEIFKKKLNILIVGCGNSELSKSMYEDGFINSISIDYSDIVIEMMNNLYGHLGLNYQCMDVRDMKYQDQTFDIIIDKGKQISILSNN